jgi:hypothetical protein
MELKAPSNKVHITTIGLPGSCHTVCIITIAPTQYAVLHNEACLPDHVEKWIYIDQTSTNTVLTTAHNASVRPHGSHTCPKI